MKGQLILAEHATAHPDGTISMLRSGIDRIGTKQLPAKFQGTLIVRIAGDLADAGPHEMDLRCMDQDGKLQLPTVQGRFEIPQGGGVTNLLFGLEVAFPEAGKMGWYLRVDRTSLDDLPFTVSLELPPAGAEQAG